MLAITALVAVVPAAMAAATTHLMLDGTTWTDTTPTPPARPTPAPTAAPDPGRTASAGPNKLIGRCAVATQAGAVLSPCGAPGVLRVVGTVRQDAAGAHPCSATPFTREVRRYAAYFLCLGTP
ncbi:hypothetical protein [Streptomyces sp. NPDC006285]|uniref:hypothetical protein n=1 Tax=Streptomyces sp. NPDC006285 TaxID=3364742 RepID=UPI00369C166A